MIKARQTPQTDAEDKAALVTALAVEVGESCDGFSFFGAVDESRAFGERRERREIAYRHAAACG